MFKISNLLKIKHYFDCWKYIILIRFFIKENYTLNLTCERLVGQCDENAIKCDELAKHCDASRQECEELAKNNANISNESAQFLQDLIICKIQNAESDFHLLKKK